MILKEPNFKNSSSAKGTTSMLKELNFTNSSSAKGTTSVKMAKTIKSQNKLTFSSNLILSNDSCKVIDLSSLTTYLE
ncbi:hypothetical protein BpHYR1_031577 [Brachionus plicatilis]|uniref:Uncharacterized protein n=1 Tax=Brachionus plicatilis TaxID=10195 RepID=A0A3M7PF40_BRAPC|nr:hypothetical protein BpHYR1_031577 [Brachionus plicatilis]